MEQGPSLAHAPTLDQVGTDSDVPGQTRASVSLARGSVRIHTGIPRSLGRYAIQRLRGRGGMGAVYEALDPALDRRVAIKVLRDDRDADTDLLRREAQLLARLVHPNVITVHDVGVDEGRVFVVIQLVTGESIDRWARTVSTDRILAAFRDAGRGLAAAHDADIVHCDFKPANVLIDADGTVRVGDFGIARLGADAADVVAGTPAYMAPEMFDGIATPASDQYAFCASLWEVLAREPLFPTSSLDTTVEDRCYRPLPRHARVPAQIERALERGLAKDPAGRFGSMAELLAALAPVRRRKRIAVAFASALAITALGAFRGATLPVAEPPPSSPSPPEVGSTHALTKLGDTACAYAPAIVGDRVVFDRSDADAVDLYEVPLAGGPTRRLTDGPAWEWRAQPGRRDGEVIHLIHDPKDPTTARVELLELATGKSTRVLDQLVNDAVASPEAVFYIPANLREVRRWRDGRDEVLATPPSGTKLDTLSRSADGKRLVAQGRGEVCVIEIATGDIGCLPARVKGRPAIGRDALYYAGPRGIHRVDLATRRDSLLLPEVHAPGGIALTPDGSQLLYSSCGSHVKLVEYAAGSQRTIVDGPMLWSPATSRDGDLAWVRPQRGAHVLMYRPVDGGAMQITHPALGDVRSPTFSPDGRRVAFIVVGDRPGIYVRGKERDLADRVQRLTEGAGVERLAWTTDGQIVFSRVDEDGPTLYAIPADGGVARKLANGRHVIGSRGREVLVSSLHAMYWLDPETGVEQPGPPHKASAFVALSPSGGWLAYAAGATGQTLWRVSTAPGAELELVGEVATGQTMREIAITDDGKVLGTPTSWSGDLFAVTTTNDTRF